MSPAQDIDELCEVAVTRLKRSGLAKSGDPVVIMAGSTSGGEQILTPFECSSSPDDLGLIDVRTCYWLVPFGEREPHRRAATTFNFR